MSADKEVLDEEEFYRLEHEQEVENLRIHFSGFGEEYHLSRLKNLYEQSAEHDKDPYMGYYYEMELESTIELHEKALEYIHGYDFHDVRPKVMEYILPEEPDHIDPDKDD